jgi:transposase
MAPKKGPHAMVRLLDSIHGLGIEAADTLVYAVFSKNFRDRRAAPRYVGLTGSPDEW